MAAGAWGGWRGKGPGGCLTAAALCRRGESGTKEKLARGGGGVPRSRGTAGKFSGGGGVRGAAMRARAAPVVAAGNILVSGRRTPAEG